MKRVINMIVVVNKNYLLLTKIREGDFWTLPGGKVEEGESDEVALRREISEELPNVTILKLIPYKDFKGVTPHSKSEVKVITFFADIKGSVEPGAELTGTKFSLLQTLALEGSNLTQITKDIVESLRNDKFLLSKLSKVMDTYRII